MAMALFTDLVQQNHGQTSEWQIASAGCWAISGLPATRNAIETMRSRGLDLDDHRSQPVTESLLNQFELVLCMEIDHKATLRRNFPEHAYKVYLLSEMTDNKQEIDDPVGRSTQTYHSTAQEISRYLESGFQKICQLTNLKI